MRTLINIYLSKKVALDRAHAPAIYGRFLSAHLDRIVDGQVIAPAPLRGPEEVPLPPDIWDFSIPYDLGVPMGNGSQHVMPYMNGGAGGDLMVGSDFGFEQFVTGITAMGDFPQRPMDPAALVPTMSVNPLDEQTWWSASVPYPPEFDQTALDLATFAMNEAYLQTGW